MRKQEVLYGNHSGSRIIIRGIVEEVILSFSSAFFSQFFDLVFKKVINFLP